MTKKNLDAIIKRANNMSLWQKVLQEATQTVKYQEGNLILAGSPGCGAKTLLQKLRTGPGSLGRHSNYSQLIQDDETYADATCPIHYFYLNAKNIEDPQSDKISRVNIWCIEKPEFRDLLDMALNPKLIANTIFGIVLDWEQPWKFVQEITMWMEIWHEKLGKALSALSLEEQDALVSKVQEHVRLYQEDTENTEMLGDRSSLPLPEGVLQVNMGVPILIIVCKSDLVWNIDRNREQNDRILDFVLKTLREMSLTYGASIVYTSSEHEKNLKVLYDYLIHRVYNFKFSHKAQVLARDEIFIPAGWDSPNLIREMDYHEITDKQYDEMLPKPKKKVEENRPDELVSDQEFLADLKKKLESSSKSSKKPKEVKTIERPDFGGEIQVNDPGEGAARSQHALESFYIGLLNKGKEQK